MRLAVPPVAGRVQRLPCKSMARLRPSGEAATDMDVPSCTVTSVEGAACARMRVETAINERTRIAVILLGSLLFFPNDPLESPPNVTPLARVHAFEFGQPGCVDQSRKKRCVVK